MQPLQFPVNERFSDIWAEDIRRFITHSCYADRGSENLTNPSKPFAGRHWDAAPTTFLQNWINRLMRSGEQRILIEEEISSLKHCSTTDQIAQMISLASTAEAAKQLQLFYGKNHAVLIVNDRTNIFVVPNITCIPRDDVTLKTDNTTTTGQQLIENIYQACGHCQQFTNWELVQEMLARLDLSQY